MDNPDLSSKQPSGEEAFHSAWLKSRLGNGTVLAIYGSILIP